MIIPIKSLFSKGFSYLRANNKLVVDNTIKFADGSEFSAINPQEPPLLEVNIPIGLQYGSNGGNIRPLAKVNF